MKKIIIKACPVTIELKICSLLIIGEQEPNSKRIIILIEDPINPDQIAKIK